MTRVLFVCLGNICRSPLGEGVLRHLARELELAVEADSAGTAAYHAGEAPDPRSSAVAAKHGVSLAGQRARQVRADDFERFDLILAMDAANLRDLRARRPKDARAKLVRFRSYDPEGDGDVPDPYYGGPGGFDEVFAMVERTCRALLAGLE
ncbi:MAG: low molecular weight phosphotyrosine protein phosphatase [Planctomycetes bacterium]|nr:low molecular weight phosphotyrosine protein phosphatase [Planctomycetota bacterium]